MSRLFRWMRRQEQLLWDLLVHSPLPSEVIPTQLVPVPNRITKIDVLSTKCVDCLFVFMGMRFDVVNVGGLPFLRFPHEHHHVEISGTEDREVVMSTDVH